MTQLTHLMQLAGAVVDLMDIQESSVLVCLENGWDATAQVKGGCCNRITLIRPPFGMSQCVHKDQSECPD